MLKKLKFKLFRVLIKKNHITITVNAKTINLRGLNYFSAHLHAFPALSAMLVFASTFTSFAQHIHLL